jgi:hypothetical protein
MTAGLLHTGRIWRIAHNDDAIGGAVPTGTVVYSPVWLRIEKYNPTLALLEQGLETPSIYSAIIQPGNIALQNNDQVEITDPNISPYKGLKFVVISDPQSSIMDNRKYWKVMLRRLEVAHGNEYQ